MSIYHTLNKSLCEIFDVEYNPKDDYEQPIDTLNITPDTKESLDADFGKLEVIVEPIEIV